MDRQSPRQAARRHHHLAQRPAGRDHADQADEGGDPAGAVGLGQGRADLLGDRPGDARLAARRRPGRSTATRKPSSPTMNSSSGTKNRNSRKAMALPTTRAGHAPGRARTAGGRGEDGPVLVLLEQHGGRAWPAPTCSRPRAISRPSPVRPAARRRHGGGPSVRLTRREDVTCGRCTRSASSTPPATALTFDMEYYRTKHAEIVNRVLKPTRFDIDEGLPGQPYLAVGHLFSTTPRRCRPGWPTPTPPRR